MSSEKEQLEALKDIRTMMERSSRFMPLSGSAGVSVGIVALIGAGLAYWYLLNDHSNDYFHSPFNVNGPLTNGTIQFILIDALLVLISAVVLSIFLTWKRSKKTEQEFFDATAKRLVINLLIPCAAGGILCIIMLSYGLIFMLTPLTLIFYGLGLVNASKYTLPEIRQLGIAQIILGLISAIILGEALIFWAIGFGILHIVCGIYMYRKYEREGQ